MGFSKDSLTLRLHDALIYEATKLARHNFISRVRFAPKPTHACMVGVDGEYLLSTLIADCGVIFVYDLSELG